MTHPDEKALAAKAWADLEMAASATGALEVARITLPIEKVRALVNERSALPSSPVSEWTAHLERVASSLEKNGFSLEAEDCQALSSTLTTLSTRNAELEREVNRLREAVNSVAETGRIVSGGIRRPAKYIRIDAASFSLCYALSTSPQGGEHE